MERLDIKMDKLKEFMNSKYEKIILDKDEALLIYQMYLEYKRLEKKK